MAEEKAKELVNSEGARTPMGLFDMDKFFNESFLRPFAPFGFSRLKAATEEIVPTVDIFESNGDVVLKAELPGIKKEDIDITISDGSITISGEKKQESEIKKKDYYKWESSYGSFCRSFALPAEIQPGKAKSTYNDGILEVRIPKTEAAKSSEVKVKIQ
ncbi:MAG: Hsp20/alpha crystallin family protein [Deltaproteobacteria bacterium]|nr:Hsp20/alpha crystallin family protein [Deltaproteobacteria bacterium]